MSQVAVNQFKTGGSDKDSLYDAMGKYAKALRPRHAADLYPTQNRLALTILQYVKGSKLLATEAPTILEPGAGGGIWGKAARFLWPDSYIVGVELRNALNPYHTDCDPTLPMNHPDFMPPTLFTVSKMLTMPDYNIWCTGSFFDPGMELIRVTGGYDFVMGNPAFDKAEEYVHQAMSLLAPGGLLVYLLPLNFLAGQKRAKQLWPNTPIYKHLTLSRRPSFLGIEDSTKTDAREYSVYIFRKGDTHRGYTGDWLLW